MKKNKQWVWLIPLIACMLTGVQCKKSTLPSKTELPPITQTGAGTFGCLVNGELWLPNGIDIQGGKPRIQLYVDPSFQEGVFYVTGHQFKDLKSAITIGSAKCKSVGTYSLVTNPNNYNAVDYYKKVNGGFQCELQSNGTPDTYQRGSIIVTRYDLVAGIFSGTFEFTLYSPTSYCGDTLRVTNGRFDVKL